MSSVKKYLKNKEAARALILSRLNYFNNFYGFKWNRVAVRNTRRRWGSCSRLNNLNFCYKILFLPSEQVDYIIIHELCHLGEFNHSKSFWNLVLKTCPDYKRIRNELKLGSVILVRFQNSIRSIQKLRHVSFCG